MIIIIIMLIDKKFHYHYYYVDDADTAVAYVIKWVSLSLASLATPCFHQGNVSKHYVISNTVESR